jgi:hypothetical protein
LPVIIKGSAVSGENPPGGSQSLLPLCLFGIDSVKPIVPRADALQFAQHTGLEFLDAID